MESDTYFEDLVHRLKESVDCESVGLYVLDEWTHSLTLIAAVGYPKELIGAAQYQVGEGLTGRITRTGELLISNSLQQLELLPEQKDKYDNPKYHSLIASPLKDKEGNILGVLRAANKKTADHDFSEADLNTLKWFAETATHALKLRQENQQIKKPVYAFVLMPFHSSFEDIYNYGIKKPIEALG